MRDDLAKWERKALNKGAGCSFESEFIPAEVIAQVRAMLDAAGRDEEVKAAFAASFRQAAESGGWGDYP